MYSLYDSLERIGDISLSSLARAARDYCADTGHDEMTLRFSSYSDDVFDPSVSAPDLTWIKSNGDDLKITSRNSAFDPPTAAVLEDLTTALVEQVLSHLRGSLTAVRIQAAPPTAPTKVDAEFELPLRGQSLTDAALVASEVSSAVEQGLRGARYELSALDALKRRLPTLLIGQAESAWLEVKRSPYRLEREAEKLELAKDVAAFGNAENGGLIVLGLETTGTRGRDVIRRVRLFDLDRVDIDRYRQILNHYVFPPLERVEIKTISVHGNRGYAYLRIPRQPPESKPILVIGHATEGRIVSHYLTVPNRRDDVVQFRNPASLHSLMVAGRIALARADEDG